MSGDAGSEHGDFGEESFSGFFFSGFDSNFFVVCVGKPCFSAGGNIDLRDGISVHGWRVLVVDQYPWLRQ